MFHSPVERTSVVTERVEQWSERVLHLGQGTLYPALHGLERQGLIRSEWRVTANNRRARCWLQRSRADVS
jgi:DNA-binding PadR family transcriptional regulator